jgi:hypothetical protein
MSMTQVRSDTAMEPPRARTVDMKLKVVVIPVSDVDRANRVYSNLGWCEGFRTPAITVAAGCTGAGVRKPTGNEPAG